MKTNYKKGRILNLSNVLCISEILSSEIGRTEASLETARLDSHLGYECEMDYVYTPFILKEKLQVLHETLDQQIPTYMNK
jgi:hypothetical protein